MPRSESIRRGSHVRGHNRPNHHHCHPDCKCDSLHDDVHVTVRRIVDIQVPSCVTVNVCRTPEETTPCPPPQPPVPTPCHDSASKSSGSSGSSSSSSSSDCNERESVKPPPCNKKKKEKRAKKDCDFTYRKAYLYKRVKKEPCLKRKELHSDWLSNLPRPGIATALSSAAASFAVLVFFVQQFVFFEQLVF